MTPSRKRPSDESDERANKTAEETPAALTVGQEPPLETYADPGGVTVGAGGVAAGRDIRDSAIGPHSRVVNERHYHLSGAGPLAFAVPLLGFLVPLLHERTRGIGMAGVSVVAGLWMAATAMTVFRKRSPTTPPTATLTDATDTRNWLAALRRAEEERIDHDLRLRSIDMSAIAVPWEVLHGLPPAAAAAAAAATLAPAGEDEERGPEENRGVDGLLRVWQSRAPARLVLCGPAGSGKSVALALLAKRLLGSDDPGRPVPVIVPLNGWSRETGLYEWIAGQLAERHPEILGADSNLPAAALLRALSQEGSIVPFLDAFDEMSPSRQAQFVRTLTQAAGASGRFVLASRDKQLADAERTAGRFRGAVTIRLTPLTPKHFRGFLDAFEDKDRWQPLIDQMDIGAAPTAARAFSTPLMQWLGLQVFSRDRRDPLALADPYAFPTAGDIERYLLASLVPAVYDPADAPSHERRWATEHAARWLRFLADRSDRGDHAIRWWLLHRRHQIPLALVYGLLTAAFSGLVTGISQTVATAIVAGGLWGAACGTAFTMGYGIQRRADLERRQVNRSGFRENAGIPRALSRFARVLPLLLAAAMAVQSVGGLLGPTAGEGGRWLLFAQGALVSAAAGLIGGFLAGLILHRAALLEAGVAPAHASNPATLLSRDRDATAVVAVCCFLAVVVAAPAAWLLTSPRAVPAAFVLAAAATGAAAGPPMFTAWPVFRAAHLVFAAWGVLPARYAPFLDSARNGGILREDGVTHQFRHELLRRSLLEDMDAPDALRRARLDPTSATDRSSVRPAPEGGTAPPPERQ